MAILNKPTYFFQSRKFRIGLTIAGVIVVLALVIFSEQIGKLLDFFGSQAGTAETVQLNSSNFMQDATQTPANSFQVDSNGRLMLNDPGN